MTSWRSHRHPRHGGWLASRGNGFSLVELLMAAVLGAVVLGGLGGALLISQMRVSASIRKSMDERDTLNRAMALMRSEISGASSISISTSTGPPSDLCGRPSLKLTMASGSTEICYKAVQLNSAASASAVLLGYGSADRPWEPSSCVLMRQGPPYNPSTGELEPISNILIRQVILDNLSSCSSSSAAFDPRVSVPAAGSSNAISRDVAITITQVGGIVTSFSARSGSNPLYSGTDMTQACGANQTVCHWVPDFSTSQSPLSTRDKINVFYFELPSQSYDLTGCTSYDNCTVRYNGVPKMLAYANVLVFADRELRP